MQITIAIKVRFYHPFYNCSKVLQISICITIIESDAYLYAKKVKTRMTRSKSRTVLRRTRDEKRIHLQQEMGLIH
ncbi:hypothetical protein T4B_5752 [Trichinella pseudospiralis]|uniref:Uncharacterized protein n=1 Tax=Trichinella pseudospiralis TaxID=6337 RepID=A0A0V1J4S8_TRIPS|nr:hypothetical protein T4B_5752 [Trichinella pseudospiralis]